MSEGASNNSTLYFLGGALLVAVLVIGYFTMGRGGSAGAGATPSVAATPAHDSGSSFKLDLDKDGAVSGTIEKE